MIEIEYWLSLLGFCVLLILVICIVWYICISVVVCCLSWILYRKHGIKLRARHHFFSLYEIHLSLKNGNTLEIEKLWIISCLYNPNIKTLFGLCASDIRLQGNGQWIKRHTDRQSSQSSNGAKAMCLPQKIISVLKIISVHVINVSIMQLGTPEEEFLLHTSFQELNIFVTSAQDVCCLTLSIVSSAIKVFKHLPVQDQLLGSESCLGHLSVNVDLRIEALAKQKLLVQSVSLNVVQPELILYEGFSISKLKRQVSSNLHSRVIDDADSENQTQLNDASMNSIDEVEKLPLFFKKFPQNIAFKVDSLTIKLMKDGGHKDFTMGVKAIETHVNQLNAENLDYIPVTFAFSVYDVIVANGHFQFTRLSKVSAKLKAGSNIIETKIQLSSFHLLYQREILQYWVDVLSFYSSNEKEQSHKRKNPSKPPLHWLEIIKKYYLQNTIDIDDIQISAKLPNDSAFSFGLAYCQCTTENISLGSTGGSFHEMLKSADNLSFELLLETVFFKIGEESLSDSSVIKRYHLWNIPFSVGMILLQGKLHETDYSTKCMVDNVQFEWSPNFVILIQNLRNYLQSNELSTGFLSKSPLLQKNHNATEEAAVPTKKIRASKLTVILNVASFNLFALSETKTAIVLRNDSLIIEYKENKLKVVSEGSKLVPLNTSTASFLCVKSSEMKLPVAHIASACVSHSVGKETNIDITDIHLQWSTTFHMTVLSIFQEFSTFKSDILSREQKVSDNHASEKDPSPLTSVSLKLLGNVELCFTLSKQHRVTFFTSSTVTANIAKQHKLAQTDQLTIIFDDHEIFTFKNLIVSISPGTEQHMLSRQSFDDLHLPNNRLLIIHMEEFKVVFPYLYNFAEACNEEFTGVIKWLKIVHKKKPQPFTLESPLPPDLSIKTKLWIIEIEDDPFEVKLRDNFELLEDEHRESLERKKMLDEEIERLRRTHLLLPAEKINELYSKLSKKKSEIYVMRSKQMYAKQPMRTALASWQLENVEILAIADLSYHGTDNVIQEMKRLDFESPYPEEGLEFSTLWARKVRCSTTSWTCYLRDFPQPLLHIRELYVWGFLIGAEQKGTHRAKRTTVIEIDSPWSDASIERNMPPLKFYHDLTFDMEDMCMSYGPCWEPVMSQFSLSMEYISRPSLDPSPSLPWWDKMRLLYHGRITYSIQHLILLMRASLDPYNTTEQMEVTWSDVIIEWTTGKILTKGDLDMYVHTASKYDDCRVLHIPSLKLSINMDWLCLGNPFDHHNVLPCAPDKIPEYSINQEHDSYRAFRSQNLNISYSYETKHTSTEPNEVPSMLFYSSTLRWVENLKMILSGVTRLTRRGKLFSNTRQRKPQLSRHYKNLRVSLNLHKFQIFYWMSFAKRRGLEIVGGRLSLSSEHTLSLVPVNDGLKHRSRPAWNIGYLNCELCDSEMWLYNAKSQDADDSTAESFQSPVERSYFLSVNRVSYGREEIVKDVVADEDKPDTPTHKLVVHGLKGAWTKDNRNVVFSLYDSYMKTAVLKRNLSTDALKCFKVESQNTPQKIRSQTNISQTSTGAAPSPVSHLQSSHAVSMLQKLIAEAEANPRVFVEEMEGSTGEQQLHGVAACQNDDVLQKKWLIELVNSQVMLKGCETSGYVIVSAAKAQILQRIHMPVWKDRSLVSKTTWVGSFECMQYYATVDAGELGPSVDNVMWLSVDNIEEKETMVISDLPDIVGSGHSVGGVVSSTVGAASDPNSAPVQLQRIVSRCGCQFFLASFGENVDPSSIEEVPPLPEDIDLWEKEIAVNSFTLTHHDLDICTNSLQYAMILDLVNNLLLYVEPQKKEAIEKLQCMKFQLQLCSVDDMREPILQLQENVRYLVSKLRSLEKEAYVKHRHLCQHPEKEGLIEKLENLENKIYECKEQLNAKNEELSLTINCFKETQIIASKSRQRAASQDKGVTVARRAEVCFKHAQWRLTDADGQLGIADLVLSNFLYSKVTKTNDSVEHLLELGYLKVTNLLPNQLYKHVLEPTDVPTKIPLDRQRLLRIYCREKAPVAGISIKEHLELNVVPITIELTDAFYKAMLKFFFPGRDTEKEDRHEEEVEAASLKKQTLQKSASTFYSERDDIEKMKERADKNHTFFYIKIPEVPLRISYKGRKDKNIEDVHNLNLVLSTLEYHNKTWTWLDLLMELKNDAKRILLSQAITQKLFKPRVNSPEKDHQPQEDEKASILLGAPERASKRHIFRKPKKNP